MAIVRDGQRVDGTIVPMFFPFKHWEYSPNGKAGTFVWSAYDSAALGFGNEITCGIPQAIDGAASLIADAFFALNKETAPKKQIFDGKQISENYSACSQSLNMELAKKQLLYGDAYNAGFWAGLLIPGLPTAKFLKGSKALPFAAKSRKVAKNPGKKAFQGRH